MPRAEHDEFNCQCHDTCGWCLDSWPVGKLIEIEINGETTPTICPNCRKDAKKGVFN